MSTPGEVPEASEIVTMSSCLSESVPKFLLRRAQRFRPQEAERRSGLVVFGGWPVETGL